MIADRSEEPTGVCCVLCQHDVRRPWGARRDEYLVCGACVGSRGRVDTPVAEESPDLSDSFWRIATADQPSAPVADRRR